MLPRTHVEPGRDTGRVNVRLSPIVLELLDAASAVLSAELGESVPRGMLVRSIVSEWVFAHCKLRWPPPSDTGYWTSRFFDVPPDAEG